MLPIIKPDFPPVQGNCYIQTPVQGNSYIHTYLTQNSFPTKYRVQTSGSNSIHIHTLVRTYVYPGPGPCHPRARKTLPGLTHICTKSISQCLLLSPLTHFNCHIGLAIHNLILKSCNFVIIARRAGHCWHTGWQAVCPRGRLLPRLS